MSNNNPKKVHPWKDKAKKYAIIVVGVLLAIWVFNIARGAQNLAQETKENLQQPEFEISYVPGGPERFKKDFDGFLDRTEQEVEPDKYLWSTLIIKNRGVAVAEDIKIKDIAATPMTFIGYEDPGYGFSEISIEHEKGDKEALINVDALEVDETLKLFIGFNPRGLEAPYDQSDLKQWTEIYDNHQIQVNVESKKREKTLNLDGLPNLYE